MPTIEQNLASILAARYGRDVRTAIHDSIEQNYDDVSAAKLRSEDATDAANAAISTANAASQEAIDNVIVSAAFSSNNINFTKADSSIVTLYNAKTELRGASAYEQAVDGGYTGTLEDFYLALKEVNAALQAAEDAEDSASAAAASAAQLASGVASPAGTYANLDALNTDDPDNSKTYITLDDGHWNYHNGTDFVSGGVYQSTGIADGSVSNNHLAVRTVTPLKMWGYKPTAGHPNLFAPDNYIPNTAILSDGTIASSAGSMCAVIPVTGGTTYYLRKTTGNRTRLAWHKSLPVFSSTPSPADYFIANYVIGTGVVAPADATYLIYMVSNTADGHHDLQITATTDYPFFIGYNFKLNIPIELPQEQALLYGVKTLMTIDYDNKTVTITTGARILYQGSRRTVSNENTPISYGVVYWQALYFDPVDSNVKVANIEIIDGRTIPIGGLICVFHPSDRELLTGVDISKIEMLPLASVPVVSIDPYYFLDDISGFYEVPDDIVSVATGQPFVLEGSTCADIYAVFDALVTTYPHYVTKTLLGNEATGKPVYQYVFAPPSLIDQPAGLKQVKIITIGAIHGYEQASSWALAQFFKDLCENHATKPQLNFMRWNVTFVVIPILNPWGYDNNLRVNSNTVDLNRNFTIGGSGAQLETIMLMDVLEANADAEWFLDFHNTGGGYPYFTFMENKTRVIALGLTRALTRKWKADYAADGAVQDETTMFCYYYGQPSGTTVRYAYDYHKMKAMVLEGPWLMPFATKKYDKISIEIGISLYGNLLTTICKSLR